MKVACHSVTTLQGRSLSRWYGKGDTKTSALNDVSLDLNAGELTLLTGPSGSGKSTLLAVLSGLLRPDMGHVKALGLEIWAMSERERAGFRLKHCGFIFEGFNLFKALTARQQLEIVVRWGDNASAREARRRADKMLSEFGLAKKAHLRPLELSGGEKQRVAIARALIKEPTFCFADEPTSSLDWGNGQHVIELLRNAAHDRSATVLLVAHDERVYPYVDRVYYLDDGYLRETGESEQPIRLRSYATDNRGNVLRKHDL